MVVRRVEPAGGALHAVVSSVPGSKSIANRALVCAALAGGTSRLANLPSGDDTAAMVLGIEALGAGTGWSGDGTDLSVAGTAGVLATGPIAIHAGLAGTTSRFVTALAALGPGPSTIDGHPPLRSRPMAPLHEALHSLGADVVAGEARGHLPVTIRGGALRGRAVALAGDVSSQFITALMLIGPYLPHGLEIELTTPLVSRPYVELTRSVMASFGAGDVEIGARRIVVEPGRYVATDYAIEPDASSASYVLAAAAVCGGEVTVQGLGAASLQGDVAFVDVLGEMGCEITRTGRETTVRLPGELRGVRVDMADISDTVPTLAVVAPFCTSPTRMTGIGFIRHKESDRIGVVVEELARCGVTAREEPDGMVIEPSAPTGARVSTHHDHRIAMAFAVLGLRVPGIEIEDPGVVSKSWPGFWSQLDGLRAQTG